MNAIVHVKPEPALIPQEGITVRLSPDDQLALAHFMGVLSDHPQLARALSEAPAGGVISKALRECSFASMPTRVGCELAYARNLLEFVPNRPYRLTAALVLARLRAGMSVAQALGDPVEKTVRELYEDSLARGAGVDFSTFQQRVLMGTPIASAATPVKRRGSRADRAAYARYCTGRFDVPRFSLYRERIERGESYFDASRPPAGVPLGEWKANVGRPSWRSWKKVQAAWDAAVADGMDMTPYEEAGRATQAALDDIPATGDETPDPEPSSGPEIPEASDDAPLANASV